MLLSLRQRVFFAPLGVAPVQPNNSDGEKHETLSARTLWTLRTLRMVRAVWIIGIVRVVRSPGSPGSPDSLGSPDGANCLGSPGSPGSLGSPGGSDSQGSPDCPVSPIFDLESSANTLRSSLPVFLSFLAAACIRACSSFLFGLFLM